jgi:O-antigen/teichoic acid export membrane protein
MPISTAQGALWLIAAKTAAFALGLAVPLLLVRQLPMREFGVYKQMLLLVDTAVVILPLGFALSAFFFFPREPDRKAQIVRNILLVHVLMGGIGATLISAFPSLPASLLNSRDLEAYAPIIGLAMLLLVGSSFIEFVAIANGEAPLAALIIAVSQFLRSALFVTAGVAFGSVRALAYAAVAHGLLHSAIVAWYVRSRFASGSWTVEWRLVRAQLAYALPLAYVGVIWWLQGWVHHYFVAHRFDAAVYAVYAVGCLQIPILGALVESVGYVAIRRVSELRRQHQTREIVRLAARSVRTLAAVAFPLYALLLVTGREFITVLFTEQYRASWPIFAVNLTLIPLIVTFPATDAVFRACPEHLPFLVRVRTALLAPLLGGLWIATGGFGLVGAIAVVVVVTLAERVVLALKSARILGMSRSDLSLFKDVAKLSAAAGVAAVATSALRLVLIPNGLADASLGGLVVSAGVFAVGYLGAVLLLKVATPAEQDAVRRWLTRASRATPWRRAAEMPEHGT